MLELIGADDGIVGIERAVCGVVALEQFQERVTSS
jgi:hypothetical protein